MSVNRTQSRFFPIKMVSSQEDNNNPNLSPFEIEDIIVTAKENDAKESVGEFYHASAYQIARAERIMDQITMLTTIASLQHSKHFDNNGIIQGHENCVTRMIMHEFSFYTQATPLLDTEFQTLLVNIHKLALSLKPNLIFFFASFPVLEIDGSISNRAVYVECGPKAKVKVTEKSVPHQNDPTYPNRPNKKGSPQKKATSFKTVGGEEIYFAFSICYELEFGVAVCGVFNKMIKHISKQSNIPPRLSLMISSNSIQVKDEMIKAISSKDNVAQADPFYAYQLPSSHPSPNQTPCTHLDVDILANQFTDLIQKYEFLGIDDINNGFRITHPPFGKVITLTFYPKHTPGKLESEIQKISDRYAIEKEFGNPENSSELIEALHVLLCQSSSGFFASAINYGLDSIVLLLMQNPIFKKSVDEKTGFSPLHYFTSRQNYEEVKKLLIEGVSPNICSLHKFTPVHIAAKDGSIKLLKLFVSHFADLSCLSFEGKTPLIYAALNNHWNVVAFILMNTTRLSPLEKALALQNSNAEKFLKTAFIEQLLGYSPNERSIFLQRYERGELAICEILTCRVNNNYSLFGATNNKFLLTLDEITQIITRIESNQTQTLFIPPNA